jgi:hypothetical protein
MKELVGVLYLFTCNQNLNLGLYVYYLNKWFIEYFLLFLLYCMYLVMCRLNLLHYNLYWTEKVSNEKTMTTQIVKKEKNKKAQFLRVFG